MREPIQRKVDLSSVQWATDHAQHYFAVCKATAEDADRDARREAAQCGMCYYSKSRVGGAMCTTALCGLCSEQMHFGNTCVDVLCKVCAKKHRLCLHCGGDVEMKSRRKL